MSNSILIGTAPFCSPDDEQCINTPGYRIRRREKANCWTGSKIRCDWDENTWKKSFLYNQLQRQDPQKMPSKPEYKWFGTAPVCNPDVCEVIKDGYIPLLHSQCDFNSCCVVNEKLLGMKPQNAQQIEQNKTEKELCEKYHLPIHYNIYFS